MVGLLNIAILTILFVLFQYFPIKKSDTKTRVADFLKLKYQLQKLQASKTKLIFLSHLFGVV